MVRITPGLNNGALARRLMPRRIADRWVRTKKAVDEAARVWAWLVGRGACGRTPDESTLFRALQTYAYRAGRRAGSRPVAAVERLKWVNRWERLREDLVERNLGLAYYTIEHYGFTVCDSGDQRSIGLMALLRAVDRFDPWRGFRFSTYATLVVRRALIQLARTEGRYRARYPIADCTPPDAPERPDAWLDWKGDRLRRVLGENLSQLTVPESMIIAQRFPMDGSERLTLDEISSRVGLSREGVRQIQKRALGKLRKVLEADPDW